MYDYSALAIHPRLEELEAQISGDGMAVMRDVGLPSVFDPSITDIVFLAADQGIEVYMSASNRYLGSQAPWPAIMARPVMPGGARLVVERCAGVRDAAATFIQLVGQAVSTAPTPIYSGDAERESGAQLDPETLTDMDAIRGDLDRWQPGVTVDPDAVHAHLASIVRGQDPALRLLARRIARHLARSDPRRPMTVFAVGPTGVGKTLTAESLPGALRAGGAQAGEYAFLRLDMAEYQEAHRVSQLLGAPQGYVGYADGAQLIDALAHNPRTIVLFDEIEKAHPHILRALMNGMDAGRLSAAHATPVGREVDCRHAVFFFTSNVESGGILDELDRRQAIDDPAVVDTVCRHRLCHGGIAPEIVGRIACFAVFRALTPQARAEVATLAVRKVAAEYGLNVVHVDPDIVLEVLERVHRPSEAFGARPYEYLIDDILGDAFHAAVAVNLRGGLSVAAGPPPSFIVVSDTQLPISEGDAQ